MLTFSTAVAPLASVTGATHEQLTSSPSNGASIVSGQRCWRSQSVAGSRSNHAARSGLLVQAIASRAGMVTATTPFCDVSLVPVHSGRRGEFSPTNPAMRSARGSVGSKRRTDFRSMAEAVEIPLATSGEYYCHPNTRFSVNSGSALNPCGKEPHDAEMLNPDGCFPVPADS